MADSTASDTRTCAICRASIAHTYKLRRYCDEHTPRDNTKGKRSCSDCGRLSWAKTARCHKCAKESPLLHACEKCGRLGKQRKCRTCEWRDAPPGKCARCLRTRRIQARGLCSTCYSYYHREHYGRKPGKKHGLTWDERLDVYIEDGWTCQICAEPVDFTADHNSDLYPSIDHIVPQSKGGTDVRTNLRTAHRLCNATRGNRTA